MECENGSDMLRRRAEELCRTIAARDLADSPLYIVPQSEVPDALGGKSICGGFTSPRLDIYLQEVIGPAWRGRGPCFVVNDTDYTATMDDLDIETDFFRTVVHELAHVLARPQLIMPVENSDAGYLLFEALCLGRCVAREETEAEEDAEFESHGRDFHRVVLHLHYRAKMAGVYLTPFQLCGYRMYQLSHANRYVEALGDEPRRLASTSFREILSIPAPKAFSQLWTEDVRRRSKPLAP